MFQTDLFDWLITTPVQIEPESYSNKEVTLYAPEPEPHHNVAVYCHIKDTTFILGCVSRAYTSAEYVVSIQKKKNNELLVLLN